MHLLCLLYILLIIVLHVIPSGRDLALNKLTVGPFRADYLLHAVLFLPWMGLVYVRLEGWRVVRSEVGLGLWIAWLLMGFGLAGAAEMIHYWLPDRTFNPMDAVSNVVGVVLGALVVGGLRLSSRFARQVR